MNITWLLDRTLHGLPKTKTCDIAICVLVRYIPAILSYNMYTVSTVPVHVNFDRRDGSDNIWPLGDMAAVAPGGKLATWLRRAGCLGLCYICMSSITRWEMASISQTTIYSAFSLRKHLNLKWNFTEIRSLRSNWQYGNIGLNNGLGPNRR